MKRCIASSLSFCSAPVGVASNSQLHLNLFDWRGCQQQRNNGTYLTKQ